MCVDKGMAVGPEQGRDVAGSVFEVEQVERAACAGENSRQPKTERTASPRVAAAL